MKVASLFTGIGGIELGLSPHGFELDLMCEIDPTAQAVLKRQFQGVSLSDDISTLKSLPRCQLVTAGFPCQDLSLAGQKAGLDGLQSGLVHHLFRLITRRGYKRPDHILFENVPYMLILDAGRAMRRLLAQIEDAGYSWAYRVIDVRSFGIPQRRQRVVLFASRILDPADILLSDDFGQPEEVSRPSQIDESSAYGFYWTMGKMGAGWAREAVPPIKGGSGLGIPSPPAVWIPAKDFVGTPQITDAERLQGFPSNWTLPAEEGGFRASTRWRLVGNAVCPAVTSWIGTRLAEPKKYDWSSDVRWEGGKWPKAAWGENGVINASRVSEWPVHSKRDKLQVFLKKPLKPLSVKATRGFHSRALVSKEIKWSPRFLNSLLIHAHASEV